MKLIDVYNELNNLRTAINNEMNFSRFCILEDIIRKLEERLRWYESKLIIDIDGEELTLLVAQERMYAEEDNLKFIIGRKFSDIDENILAEVIQRKIDNIKITYNSIHDFVESAEVMDDELDELVNQARQVLNG